MTKKNITEQEALDSMFGFIRENLKGLSDVKENQNHFYGKKEGIDFILDVVKEPIESSSFLDYVNDNSRKGIATGIVMLRSITQYDGKLLKQLEYLRRDGKNFFWKNQKKLTKFEQDVLDLYGNQSAYYNPQDDIIQIVHTKKFRKIPEFLASRSPEKLANNKSLRKTLHIEESKRNSWRKIWIPTKFKDSFTLNSYKRGNKILARIAPYESQPSLL